VTQWRDPLALLLVMLARGWQLSFSLVLPPSCRFQPSCSAYAIEAVRRHGGLAGGWLAVRRLLRCHPWGGHGHDPVPDAIGRSPLKDIAS
jgi:hypothetical protein